MKRRTECRRLRLVAALVLASATGAMAAAAERSDEWSLFRGDRRLTGRATGSLPDDPRPVWTFETEGGVESTAAASAGTVFVGSLEGRLYALDLASGTLRWVYETGEEIQSSPAVRDGTVFFGDESGAFHAVDAATGEARWVFRADGGVVSSANFAGNRVVFGSKDNFLYCLSVDRGELRWKLETESYIYSTPAILGGPEPAALVTGCDGYLRSVRVSDGTEVDRIELGAYVGASPAIEGNRAYVGTFENQVLAVDLESGGVLWRYENPERSFPFYSSAALGDGLVVIGGRDKLLHAIEADTGRARWTFPTRARIDSSPVIVGARAFFGGLDGKIRAVDLATGKASWSFDAGSGIAASPCVASGRLVLGTVDGLVYCFGKATRKEP